MSPADQQQFTEEQKQYLQGFAAGSGIARTLATVPTFAGTLAATAAAAAPAAPVVGSDRPSRPEDIHLAAQERVLAAGGKLCAEETAKRNAHGLDIWDKVVEHARDKRFPKGTDVFLFKFQGLFYVAPAQDAFMCRLRFAGGVVKAAQLRGLGDLADCYAGGYADVTTRANLQLREVRPDNTVQLLMGLHELGIINRGAGADNVRNITATPTTGFDPQELYDVRPLARDLHHYILNHRELYGLPRKFNVAFDSGGVVGSLEDTNDVGFTAVRVRGSDLVPDGIYFRLSLGGITGHQQFARDVGVVVEPGECTAVAVAGVKVFIEHGDRTDRKKARLKYVLDRLGYDAFLEEMEKHLPAKLKRVPLDACDPRPAPLAASHIGFHPQKQERLHYVGVIGAAGRYRADQLRTLAEVAEQFGCGECRLSPASRGRLPSRARTSGSILRSRSG